MSKLTLAEQETILRYDRESDMATIYTHDQGLIRDLVKRGFTPTFVNTYGGRVVAQSFDVPKAIVAIRFKRRVSAERRAKAAADLQKSKQSAKSSVKKAVSDTSASPAGSDLFSSGGGL